jgi:histidinol-phosphate aminotransferase
VVVSRAAEPRPGLRDVQPYVSPQIPVRVRLNTNEAPRPLPAGFADDLADAVRSLPLNRYPDGQMTRLREDLAAFVGHTFDGTWAANGSNEILTELLLAYGGPGRSLVVFEPTYSLHSRLARLTSTEVVRLRLDERFRLTDGAIAEAAAADPDIVFVCSPNNPTGNAQPLEAVRALAETVNALVIVDEAYVEFGGETALKLVVDHPNVALTRTLSKAFALAGVRIGYCLATPEVVQDLQRVRLPYHMSALTQAAGIAALRHAPEALAMLDAIRAQRDRILDALGALKDVTVYPSDANFVLFTPPPDHETVEVWQALLDRGILIRDLTSVVPRALRVTAGTEDETTQFFDAITEVLA